jgi:hypothetical protein
MAWFDRVRMCVGWDKADRARIAELRRWMDSDVAEMIETLGEQLAQFKGTQSLMANVRFAQRFHGVLREWLIGLLDGEFNGEYARERWAFGQKLVELDFGFEDIILLEELTRRQLFELAQRWLDERPQMLSTTMRTLDKALSLDLALVYSGYLQVRDAEVERALLSQFLDVTGFSRTLYENLAEAREWSEGGQ